MPARGVSQEGLSSALAAPRASVPGREPLAAPHGRSAPGPKFEANPAYAALDLGTNNCRMLVAVPRAGGFRIVDSVSRSVSLGADLERTGRLSSAGAGRVLRAMQLCAHKLRKHGVERHELVATQACRQAANAADVLTAVKRDTGLSLQIIRPELEARLALTSCAPLVAPEADHLMVFDIGGGSTELILLDLRGVPAQARRKAVLELAPLKGSLASTGRLGARILDWISVPLGVATLHQKFQDVADDRARFALMSRHFEELVASFAAAGADMPSFSPMQMIGTSGTVTTIAAASLGLQRYNRDRVDGAWLDRTRIEEIVAGFLGLSYRDRTRHPAIGANRARLIVSGIAILQTFLRLWPVERLRVADRGLREGLLYAMMNEDGHYPGGLG
ncbi:MAG: Ppx/GppA phosphatase family protein [Pseudomonadota bacterium]